MQNEVQNDNNEPGFFVVSIHDFFGPQEPKTRLVRASTEEEAKVITRMGNPDLIKGFVTRDDAVSYLDEYHAGQWDEL